MVYVIEVDLQQVTTVITKYEYYTNGMLKRRIILRIPQPEGKFTYVGGPGSDDMSYEYTYYKNGLIKKMYCIIGETKYKLAKYRYE